MIDDDGEVRELKGSDFKRARSASEALPSSLQAKLGLRAKKAEPKDEGPESSPRLMTATGHPAKKAAVDDEGHGFHRVGTESLHRFKQYVSSMFVHTHVDSDASGSFKDYLSAGQAIAEHSIPYRVDHQVYEHLVHTVTAKYSMSAVHPWKALWSEGRAANPEALESMSRTEMLVVVQIQSELIERFKVLLDVVSGEDISAILSEPTQLDVDVHKSMLAKRLRDMAEEVEMSGVRARRSEA